MLLLRNQKSGPGDAGLTAVTKGGSKHMRNGPVEIGVVEQDLRPAAELQGHALEGFRGGSKDCPPGRRRTGKGDLGDTGVLAEFRADDMAVAIDDVEHAARRPASCSASSKVWV